MCICSCIVPFFGFQAIARLLVFALLGIFEEGESRAIFFCLSQLYSFIFMKARMHLRLYTMDILEGKSRRGEDGSGLKAGGCYFSNREETKVSTFMLPVLHSVATS